jgi:RNA polymerase sigma-70 factor, ECF subfamily
MDALLPPGAVEGIAARDPDALAACYEAFADPLYRYVLSRCGDPGLAEELVEETFTELVGSGPTLEGGGRAVRAWLFPAARNNLIEVRRKAQRRADDRYDEPLAARIPDAGPGPEQAALAEATAASVRSALARLSPDHQDVFLLRFAGGLTGPEAAAVLGKSVGAVKALQHRGLVALAALIDEEGNPRP